ncbi:hypothetical protein JW933_02225 [candidate division FCPU426 bacterium]|nr:hypothetical protein [candidate division FCPU426 bacterium]
MTREIIRQLGRHAPYTALGTATGVLIILLIMIAGVARHTSEFMFWSLHPLHVFLSALVTTAVYRLHGQGGLLKTLVIGYAGSIGIATLSDSLIPFIGEWLLQMPRRGVHFGFIEKWWLVNPLALLGIGVAWIWPHTKLPHAGHVLLSTWASLFHMTMAMEGKMDLMTVMIIVVFLFLAVWVPCCTSDIVFPLLWVKKPATGQ